jgi:hypothetical protein
MVRARASRLALRGGVGVLMCQRVAPMCRDYVQGSRGG